MDRFNKLFVYRKRFVRPYIDQMLKMLSHLSRVAALLLLVTVVFKYGFIVSKDDHATIDAIFNFVLHLFIYDSLLHVLFSFAKMRERYSRFMWVMTLLLYLTIIPMIFFEPAGGFSQLLWRALDGGIYKSVVLVVISVLYLSDALMRLLGRRANPSLLFAASFIVIILVGAGLLMLPRATYEEISFVDALFISTSATCVTGLASVDVATVFTPLGTTFIAILMQIGGLGVMTLTSFFALFFMGGAPLSNQTLISDLISSKSLNSLLSTLLYILGFTAVIETIGALAIFWQIHGTLGMTINEEIAFSFFHSISAFCNAGFSTLPGNLGADILMSGHNMFYITISLLVILGGIGFPILVNLNRMIIYLFKRLRQFVSKQSYRVERQVHLYDINTKIVVATTALLLTFATLFIAIIEWNGAFVDMPTFDKLVHSFFAAVVPRTAGFNSVATSGFGMQTLLLFIFLMVIGGGSQSTAGGIKINAFAVIVLNIRSLIQGRNSVTLFSRALSIDSIRRSNTTLVLYILFIFGSLFLLTIFEPGIPIFSLAFEAISALSTVGASLDVTPVLGSDSKIVLILLMFIGRVGVLAIVTSIVRQKSRDRVGYPSGEIIIN